MAEEGIESYFDVGIKEAEQEVAKYKKAFRVAFEDLSKARKLLRQRTGARDRWFGRKTKKFLQQKKKLEEMQQKAEQTP